MLTKTISGAGKPLVDPRQRGISRYRQLATLFRHRIETGVWGVGEQIPTVNELSVSCDVARETVRQALDILEGEGLIQRFRAKGTFVTAAPSEKLWCKLETSYFGLLQSREGARAEIMQENRGVSLPALDNASGTPAVTYRHIRRRHWRDDRPYMVADIFIAEPWASNVSVEALVLRPTLRLAADLPGLRIGDVEQVMTIDIADMALSDALKTQLNAPVVRVDRHVTDEAGVIVMFTRNVYRGDVVRLDFKLR